MNNLSHMKHNQLEEARRVIERLPTILSQRAAASVMGVSLTMLQLIEREAIHKVIVRLKEDLWK